jgi:hypothetical protein
VKGRWEQSREYQKVLELERLEFEKFWNKERIGTKKILVTDNAVVVRIMHELKDEERPKDAPKTTYSRWQPYMRTSPKPLDSDT